MVDSNPWEVLKTVEVVVHVYMIIVELWIVEVTAPPIH